MHSAAGILLILLSAASSTAAAAMDARIVEVRAIGSTVRASVDLTDIFSGKFTDTIQSGQALYLRLQTELWEDRPLWDKLVRPAMVSVFRVMRESNSEITVADAVGVVATLEDVASALSLRVDAVAADAISDSGKYYLRLIATIGTIETQEATETGDAVFGRDESAISMARVGKLIFRTVVRVADYLQSVTTETRTPILLGRAIKAGAKGF